MSRNQKTILIIALSLLTIVTLALFKYLYLVPGDVIGNKPFYVSPRLLPACQVTPAAKYEELPCYAKPGSTDNRLITSQPLQP
jgi:hypothetical protein